jgi:hypothetical protein
MNAVTSWYMGCIIAVTLGENFTTTGPVSTQQGHCVAATLLSVVILSLSGKPELLEQNACGTSLSFSLSYGLGLLACSNSELLSEIMNHRHTVGLLG